MSPIKFDIGYKQLELAFLGPTMEMVKGLLCLG